MSKIITLLPRHYIGTAVEIAGITGVCGDTAYSSDTDVYYHWGGASWVVGGKSFYVPRDTPGVPDFDHTDFTCDGFDHVNGLDLTAIVPAGAVAITLHCIWVSAGVGNQMTLFRNITGPANQYSVVTQVAGLMFVDSGPLVIDADRLVDYNLSANVIAFSLWITGWSIGECL